MFGESTHLGVEHSGLQRVADAGEIARESKVVPGWH
jgi:hypothetical protein